MKIFFAILISFIFISNIQAQEVIGSESYQLPEYITANYNLVRTDTKGNVVWQIPYSKDFFTLFDTTQSSYLIYGYTYIRDKVIFNNPSDYDYWLVPNDNVTTAIIYPTLTTGIVYLYLTDVRELSYVDLYNLQLQRVFNSALATNLTTIDLTILPQGLYIYKIFNKSTTLKTGKIVKL